MASNDNLTEEQKRRMAGMCCYNMLTLTATAAFMCAITSYAYCDFISRTVNLTEGNTVDSVCTSEYGATSMMKLQCEQLLNPHGVGFEGFWTTVPVDQQVCYPFTLMTPYGYQTPELDTKFNSARALSICGIVFGGAAWFTLMLASCCKLDQGKLKGMSCYFFLATLFQGLSLLILRSNVCSPGFFTVYFTDPNDPTTTPTAMPSWMAGVSCGLSKGSKLAISATVLWFVCSNMLPAAVVPDPLWKGSPQPTPGVVPTGDEEVAEEEQTKEMAEDAPEQARE